MVSNILFRSGCFYKVGIGRGVATDLLGIKQDNGSSSQIDSSISMTSVGFTVLFPGTR